MNIREAQQAIIEQELPASEAAILLNQVSECPHWHGKNCDIVDICDNCEDFDNEPF